ncbi:hypothetical protein HY948_01985 [Candidatus Gottesmanbacteria bacterium]|nr:hypothetical protein [Candidatus Gottesmanbacteria bacterium]
MPDLSSGNRERLAQYRAEAQKKLELQHEEQAHAEATLGEIREELGALAFAAGISLEELHVLLSQYGDRGSEALRYLIEGKAATVEEALQKVWKDAGDEAGAIIDPIGAAFGKRLRGGPDLISQIIYDEESAHPHRKRHKRGKAEIGELAALERWLHQDPSINE